MTPTRQAACAILAGLAFSSASASKTQVQQDTTQPAAPIVRAVPRRPSQSQTAPGSIKTGAATGAGPQSASKIPGPALAPGTTPAMHKPRPATTPVPGRATAIPQASTTTRPLPSISAGTAAPRIIVKPAVPNTGTSTVAAAAEGKPAAPRLSATGLNRNVIVLDPAHGGADSGGRIGESTLEKDVTLALAFRLRSLLVARGFTVVMTRESDSASPPNTPPVSLSLDDRAGIADHARAAACLLLHATGRGTGVHLYGSDLEAAPTEASLLPWLTAQAAWVPASHALEQGMTAALGRSHIALVSSTASVRPVDSLTCPALVLELAPETDVPASVNDAAYQERVAAAIAGALVVWQNAVQAPVKALAPITPHPPVHHTAPLASEESQP
ncbi:MAG: N-acetylmuramoyl-L-alanine amidase [Janthinobacterium lividum]